MKQSMGRSVSSKVERPRGAKPRARRTTATIEDGTPASAPARQLLFELPKGTSRLHLPGVPKETYLADHTAVTKSLLDQVDRSPAHALAYMQGLRHKKTAELSLGDIAHAMILEADSVHSHFLHPDRKLDRRRNPDKHIWDELAQRANAEHKTLLNYDTWTAAIQVRDAVYRHKTARAILAKGSPEQTFLWRDPATGELCKCRVDWLRDSFYTDVKTAVDASPAGFGRAIINYRYDVQDAHYTSGVDDPSMGFVFIAVETEPPYAVAVYADHEAMRRLGRIKRDRNLATFAECRRTNQWPGYPEEVQTVQLPAWAMREFDTL